MDASVDDLPDALLVRALAKLPGKDLARVAVASRRLRDCAAEPRLWRDACLAQWPQARTDLPQAYGDSWRLAFAGRACLPATFVKLVDRLHQYDQDEEVLGDVADEGFEQMMHGVFSVGVMCSPVKSKALRECAEYAALRAELRRRLSPELELFDQLLRFVTHTRAMLDDYDFWGGGFVQWPNIPWRRSALQFLVDMLMLDGEGGPSDLEAEARWKVMQLQESTAELDDAIKSAAEEAVSLARVPPAGIPHTHFWYYLDRSYVDRC